MPRLKLAAAVALTLIAGVARACPFCTAESRTLTEEINDSSVVLLARLSVPSEASEKLAEADMPYGFVDPETGIARFAVLEVLVGGDVLGAQTEVEAIYFGEPDKDRTFLLRGVGNPPDWAIPLPLSEVAAAYVPKLLTLPEGGSDRLDFFQQYLQHEDPVLGQDAYDEFARAPYQDVIDLAPRMDKPQLRAWIEDPSVSPSRRRLFLTMLGVCGDPEDVDRLERMLTSDARILGPAAEAAAAVAFSGGGPASLGMLGERVRFGERQRKLGLDALIACYLTLAGSHGDASEALDLIDQRFLEDPGADYSHIYAALQALRFLAQEQTELVPRPRVIESARLLLNNGDFADQVIPDLARWEDWSVLERLTDMYRRTFDEDDPEAPVKYVREPIVTYLDVAAELPGDLANRAKAALAEIEPLDPDAVARARSLRAFGFLAGARARQADEAVVATAEDFTSDPEPSKRAVAATPTSPPPKAEAALPEPPSTVLLIGAPLVATAALIGLFWLILRGGVA